MTSTVSASAEARLESLLKPYRDLSHAHMESIWTEFAAEHPEGSFPSTKTMRQNSRLFLAGKRYRFALALAGYRLLTGERPSQDRSEEHTSELQSQSNLVCRLLLEKKKKIKKEMTTSYKR